MAKVLIKNDCYKGKTVLRKVNLNNVEWDNNDMTNAFNGCTNLESVSSINSNVVNMTSAFQNCTSLKNDIYISAKNVENCNDIFKNNNIAKKVYVYYKNQDETNTKTYNRLKALGYDSAGSKDAVYLDDISDNTGVKLYRFGKRDGYRSRYGFITDEKDFAFSLVPNDTNNTSLINRIDFYNENEELVDTFFMPSGGDINCGVNTNFNSFLGTTSLTTGSTTGDFDHKAVRFFKRANKYWGYYVDSSTEVESPFNIWYSFKKNNNIYCIPNAPYDNGPKTLKIYLQTGKNTFDAKTNTVDTTKAHPIYFSHTNNCIYSLEIAVNNGINTAYVLNLNENYDIISKTWGFTVDGDSIKLANIQDTVEIARELNADFTPGTIQLTKLTNSVGEKQWFVLSETEAGKLDCNTARNLSLRDYFGTKFNNQPILASVYAIPGNYFIAFNKVTSGEYKVFKFHFENNTVIDDGVLFSVPAGYIAPDTESKIYVNYFAKTISWSFYKSDLTEYLTVVKNFNVSASLPEYAVDNSTTVSVDENSYDTELDVNNNLVLKYKGTDSEITIPNISSTLAVKLQFKDNVTGQMVSNIYDYLTIPQIILEGAIATRNMFEYLVPAKGQYKIKFIPDSSGTDRYRAPDLMLADITSEGQVITIPLDRNF